MTRKSQTRLNREELDRRADEHQALLIKLESDHIAKYGKWRAVPSRRTYEDAVHEAAQRTGDDLISVTRALQWARSLASKKKTTQRKAG